MGIRVIVDTNCLLSDKSFEVLLGNRQVLTDIAEFATILLPEIVVDELIKHKQISFEKAKGTLLCNALLKYLSFDTNQIMELSFDRFEACLRADQSIPYRTISISNESAAFEKALNLAIGHSAPFEKESDKGFKDTCIAISIEEYLSTISPEERVFLCSNDTRLREYFESSEMIITITSLADLKNKLSIKGQEEEELTAKNIKDASESDSIGIKEPTPGEKAKSALLTEFRNSGSFMQTHLLVEKLAYNEEAFNEKDYCDILRSACNNSQIYWILDDTDIAEFLVPIFEKYGKCLDSDSYSWFIKNAGLTESKIRLLQSYYFSEEEKLIYRGFASELESCLTSIGSNAIIVIDPEYVLPRLKELLIMHELEETTINNESVLGIFINGKFSCSKGDFPVKAVENLVFLMDKAIDDMQKVILRSIERRLSSALIDFSDEPLLN